MRNPSAINRYPAENIPSETDTDQESNTEQSPKSEIADDGIPDDMGNRLPTGGRSGNKKVDKFQGYKTPPMY